MPCRCLSGLWMHAGLCLLLGACGYLRYDRIASDGTGSPSRTTGATDARGCDAALCDDISSLPPTVQALACAPALSCDIQPHFQYWLEEAAAGQGPTHLVDWSANPMDLPIDYTAADTPVFGETDGGERFLRFSSATVTDSGAARSPRDTNDAKILALNGRTRATLEVRFELERCESTGFRVFGMGDGNNPASDWFSLREWGSTPSLVVSFQGPDGLETFAPSGTCLTGTVQTVHWVIDTEQEAPEDRVRHYIEGQRAEVRFVGSTDGYPAQGAGIRMQDTGNPFQVYLGGPYYVETPSARSADLKVLYAAVYLEALSDAQVSEHAAALRP